MPERLNHNEQEPRSIEEIKLEIVDYIKGETAGSAKILALSDVIDKEDATTGLNEFRDSLIDLAKNPRVSDLTGYKIEQESELRMAELEVVAVNQRVKERTAMVPGYLEAFEILNELANELGETYIAGGKSAEEADRQAYQIGLVIIRHKTLIPQTSNDS